MSHRFAIEFCFCRAVQLLPRVDQLWYKYIHMEEMLGNFQGVRRIYERWMDWEPDVNGWQGYINFENRYGEVERARQIYERFIRCHPRSDIYIRYAKFEVKYGQPSRGREVYERAFAELDQDACNEEMFKVSPFPALGSTTTRCRGAWAACSDTISRPALHGLSAAPLSALPKSPAPSGGSGRLASDVVKRGDRRRLRRTRR